MCDRFEPAEDTAPDAGEYWEGYEPNPEAYPVTKTGRVLTPEDIEELADEAERGYDVGHLAGWHD